jgi:hypothetical protein
MGWIMLSKPGDEYGPCVGNCKHKDCEASRQEARMPCRFCHKEIGYETKFYIESFYDELSGKLTGRCYSHFICSVVEAEKLRKAMR